jgi:hypothetical protein
MPACAMFLSWNRLQLFRINWNSPRTFHSRAPLVHHQSHVWLKFPRWCSGRGPYPFQWRWAIVPAQHGVGAVWLSRISILCAASWHRAQILVFHVLQLLQERLVQYPVFRVPSAKHDPLGWDTKGLLHVHCAEVLSEGGQQNFCNCEEGLEWSGFFCAYRWITW